MRQRIAVVVFSAMASAVAGQSEAAGYPWRDHAAPYDFRFGNEFDSHQQTRTTADGALSGFLYIHYTGDVTSDGLPVATHADCASASCDVGWLMSGLPATAAFLYQVDGDHPVWLVDRRDIPQPGAYAHFHWLGAMPTTRGAVSDGYLLQLQAIRSFCFLHHDGGGSGTCDDRGGVAVRPGTDIATHLNVVASAP